MKTLEKVIITTALAGSAYLLFDGFTRAEAGRAEVVQSQETQRKTTYGLLEAFIGFYIGMTAAGYSLKKRSQSLEKEDNR